MRQWWLVWMVCIWVTAAPAGTTNLLIQSFGTFTVENYTLILATNADNGRIICFESVADSESGASEQTWQPGWFVFVEFLGTTNRVWKFDGKEKLSMRYHHGTRTFPALPDWYRQSAEAKRILKVQPWYFDAYVPFPAQCPGGLQPLLPAGVVSKYWPTNATTRGS